MLCAVCFWLYSVTFCLLGVVGVTQGWLGWMILEFYMRILCFLFFGLLKWTKRVSDILFFVRQVPLNLVVGAITG